MAPSKEQLAHARALEQQGQLAESIREYVAAGAVDQAARILAGEGRYADAADVILNELGVRTSEDAARVSKTNRRDVVLAAQCLEHAFRNEQALEIYLAIGEHDRALSLCERVQDSDAADRIRGRINPSSSGSESSNISRIRQATAIEESGDLSGALEIFVALKQYRHAGRVAHKMHKYEQAAKYYIDAAMPFEAAICYEACHDPGRCYDVLVRVPRDDPRYRVAAVEVIKIAEQLSVLDFKLEQFLVRFLSEGPETNADLEALYRLARLYQKHDDRTTAKEIFEKVHAIDPNFLDVAQQIEAIDNELRAADRSLKRIMRDEKQFHDDRRKLPSSEPETGTANFPGMPALPQEGPPVLAPAASYVYQPGTMNPYAPNLSMAQPMAQSLPQFPMNIAANPQMKGWLPTPAPAPAPMPTPPITVLETFEVGSTIANRYQLRQRIGKGGMSVVFKAHDQELGLDIAMKVFQEPLEGDEQLVQRFKQELILSRKLMHPNIIRLYDFGVLNSYRYITMELLSGQELKAELGKPMALARGLDFLIQACAALQHAHDAGVIHRDIKPQNFFVTNDDVLKMMDFGIAKHQAASGVTQTGTMAGTPNYMSPEQINGFSQVTASTDIYALGCVAYEMFTGEVPFTHSELMPLLMMHLTKPPIPPREKNPQLPKNLERIILKLMAKVPAQRYGSCRELSDELVRIHRSIKK